MKFVASIASMTFSGISSTQPTPAMPALCTTPSGAPMASRIREPAFSIDDGSRRSSGTPMSRSGS